MALDLTPEEVVLYEGGGAQGWQRFAGVALEDPEFLAVIGLLRAEAENALGAGRPVRLWLPGEQVLALTARIAEREPAARLRAAFRHASRETGHAAREIAVAVAPPGDTQATTLLVTYAATWHEARDYATRWGFVPGPVSTRHQAEAFGPAGPEFLLEDATREAAPAGRARQTGLALALAAMLGPLIAPPAAASQAPAAAPLPEARAFATAPPAADEMPGLGAMLPPPRPDPSGGPQPGASVAPSGTPVQPSGLAPSDLTPSDLTPSGLAAPRPRPRPARPSGAGAAPGNATAGGTAVAAVPSLFPAPATAAAEQRGLPRDRAALVGVLELESGRKALLRLPDGSYRRVEVGDVLDGWRVSAIGVDALRVSRGSESRTLMLVSR